MSSLAAVQADGYYINPAAYNPAAKRGSANAIAGSHALGVRANRLYTEGILVIRFEMPHDSWCNGCGEHVARGVRFNADKKQEGAYHSTRIYSFSMKCPACPQIFVIKTDPKNTDYEYVSGIRKKVKTYDAASAETMQGKSHEQAAALVNDAFFKLEHVGDDKRRAQTAHERLTAIAGLQDARYADDAASNAALRAGARAQRHAAAALAAEARGMRFAGRLLPASDEDGAAASAAMASRDLDRLEQGRLRTSGGGGRAGDDVARRVAAAAAMRAAQAAAGVADPPVAAATLRLLDSATSVLHPAAAATGAGGRPAAPPPCLPVAVAVTASASGGASTGGARAAASDAPSAFPASAAAQVSGRLAALRAALASEPPLSALLPPGRAAQLLSQPLMLARSAKGGAAAASALGGRAAAAPAPLFVRPASGVGRGGGGIGTSGSGCLIAGRLPGSVSRRVPLHTDGAGVTAIDALHSGSSKRDASTIASVAAAAPPQAVQAAGLGEKRKRES